MNISIYVYVHAVDTYPPTYSMLESMCAINMGIYLHFQSGADTNSIRSTVIDKLWICDSLVYSISGKQNKIEG